MPKNYSIEELEDVVRRIVRYELGEPKEYCMTNLGYYGVSDEMKAFFGVPSDYFDRPVQKPAGPHPFTMRDLEAVLSNVVDFELGESDEDCIYNLSDFGFSKQMMMDFGVPESIFDD